MAVELALAGTPTALLYRAHWLTELLMRKSLRIGCASLPNLVALDRATGPYPCKGALLQPERLFRDATEDAAVEALGCVCASWVTLPFLRLSLPLPACAARRRVALAAGAPPEGGDAALTLLAAWHAEHGLPIRFSDAAAAAVEAEVAGRGGGRQ